MASAKKHSGRQLLLDVPASNYYMTTIGQEWAAGTISDFVTEEHIEHKLANRTDRMTHFTLSAIQEALQDAQLLLEQENPRRVGAVIANAMGGVGFVLNNPDILYKRTSLRQCLYRYCLAQRCQHRADSHSLQYPGILQDARQRSCKWT